MLYLGAAYPALKLPFLSSVLCGWLEGSSFVRLLGEGQGQSPMDIHTSLFGKCAEFGILAQPRNRETSLVRVNDTLADVTWVGHQLEPR